MSTLGISYPGISHPSTLQTRAGVLNHAPDIIGPCLPLGCEFESVRGTARHQGRSGNIQYGYRTAALTHSPFQRPAQALLRQLVGAWDVDYRSMTNMAASTYSWILDGAALQEIWTSDLRGTMRPYGTTIEFYDPKRHQWNAIWIYPELGMTCMVSSVETNSRIVLTRCDQQGVLQRWMTKDLQPGMFLGRFEISRNGGRTWQLAGINHMRRHVQP